MRGISRERIRFQARRVLDVPLVPIPPPGVLPPARQVLFRSPTLSLYGRTLINAFVTLTVIGDDDPTGLLILQAAIRSASTGGFAAAPTTQLASAGAYAAPLVTGQALYTGPGQYVFPVGTTDQVLASAVVWQLDGVAADQIGSRRLSVTIDGLLIAGGSTGVP